MVPFRLYWSFTIVKLMMSKFGCSILGLGKACVKKSGNGTSVVVTHQTFLIHKTFNTLKTFFAEYHKNMD